SMLCLFFFSSRRRHTRFSRDWSSDVCSSDLAKIGPTLVCSAITKDPKFSRALIDARHIDRLNIGPIPTVQLNWFQPHEGSIVDFLFRARAFQTTATEPVK